jgi:hypothetical protein
MIIIIIYINIFIIFINMEDLTKVDIKIKYLPKVGEEDCENTMTINKEILLGEFMTQILNKLRLLIYEIERVDVKVLSEDDLTLFVIGDDDHSFFNTLASCDIDFEKVYFRVIPANREKRDNTYIDRYINYDRVLADEQLAKDMQRSDYYGMDPGTLFGGTNERTLFDRIIQRSRSVPGTGTGIPMLPVSGAAATNIESLLTQMINSVPVTGEAQPNLNFEISYSTHTFPLPSGDEGEDDEGEEEEIDVGLDSDGDLEAEENVAPNLNVIGTGLTGTGAGIGTGLASAGPGIQSSMVLPGITSNSVLINQNNSGAVNNIFELLSQIRGRIARGPGIAGGGSRFTEPIRVTLTEEEFNKLERLKYSDDFLNNTCTVCMCDFEKDEDVLRLPKCMHIFHEECIKPWLCKTNKKCPICKVDVAEGKPNL